MDKPKRILVFGHARHGKDTVCEFLQEKYGYSFISSSEFACVNVVFPLLAPKYGYKAPKECFDDRGNHRAEWYDAIREFNREDPTRLGRAIWSTSNLYCGLRSAEEFEALRDQEVFDVSIWVDAGSRVGKESAASITVKPWMADHIIDNSGSLEDLHKNITSLMSKLSLSPTELS